MKTFHTERDIEEMHAAGVTEINVNDNVILTHLAFEKALSLGMRIKTDKQPTPVTARPLQARSTVAAAPPVPPSASPASPPDTPSDDPDPVVTIKKAVTARLGTDKYDELLDRIIPLVRSLL